MKVVPRVAILVVALWEVWAWAAVAQFINEVVVQLDGDEMVADLVAGAHGFRVKRQLPLHGNYFVFEHPNVARRAKRSMEDLVATLKTDPSVKFAEQQRLLVRDKRAIVHDKQRELPIQSYDDKTVFQRFNGKDEGLSKKYLAPRSKDVVNFSDPYWPDMWYLYNFGQSGGPPGYDVNVVGVWKSGFTGKGVVVCILDDGIDYTHPDLVDNYDPEASYDLNGKDYNPTPNVSDPVNSHGTRCAGEVAAKANNSVCGVGIAFDASIGGVRMLDGQITDSLEADAILYHNDHIHIYSASWGPTDDGTTMEGPGALTTAALKQAAEHGRSGLGNIFMWATGNGGTSGDTCSCDGYVSSIYTASIGSISDHGLSTYFSEICPATLAVIFTGGSHLAPTDEDYKTPKLKVTTTDINGGCTLNFQGTSSAAPLAAGCVALTLQANPALTWRDVQHVIVQTARIPSAANDDNNWTLNGAGLHVNPRFGFGAMDCGRMVEVAQNWSTVGEHHVCHSRVDKVNLEIPTRGTLVRTIRYAGCNGRTERIDSLEHVQIHVKAEHPRRGDVNMFIVSPSGTRSEILRVRTKDKSSNGIDFTFMTVHSWGEDPQGDWVLEVTDRAKTRYDDIKSRSDKRGRLINWSLTFYGTCCKSPKSSANKSDRVAQQLGDGSQGDGEAHSMDTADLRHTMIEEEQEADHLHIKSDIVGEDQLLSSLRSLDSLIQSLDAKDLRDLLGDNDRRRSSTGRKSTFRNRVLTSSKKSHSYRDSQQTKKRSRQREAGVVSLLKELLDESK